jgi:hypothetical protein
MKSYRVVVTETITERKVFMVDADSPLDAAKVVSSQFLTDDKPVESSVEVEDRDYTVMSPSKDFNLGVLGRAHKVYGVFDDLDFEEPEDDE